jgi:hypothetical protein
MEESVNIAEDVAYERLSTGILEFTVRARTKANGSMKSSGGED